MPLRVGGGDPVGATTGAGVASSRGLGRGAALAVGGAAALLLVAGSWVPAWSGDEAATVMVARRPLDQVLQTVESDPALLPYYLLANVWALPSTSEWWLRLPSVLAMATAVGATSLLATRMGGRWLGLLAAATMLVLPAVSRYGQDARPYAFSVLLVVALTLRWYGGLGSWSRRAVFVGLVAVLGLLQPYALLILPVLVLTSLLAPSGDRRREVVVTTLCAAAGVVLVVPHLLVVADRAVGQPDPAPVTAANMAEELLRLPVGMLSPPLTVPAAAVTLALLAVGVILWWRRGERRQAVLLATWVALPPLVLCGLQLLGWGPGLVARYWTFCLPAIAIGAAVTVKALWSRSRTAAIATCLLVVVLTLPSHLALRAVDGHLGQGWRDLPRVLAHPTLQDAPLLVEGWTYRALLSNEPALHDRMVLIVDPAPEGRINPRTHGPDSPAFARLTEAGGPVVVLQSDPGVSAKLPGRRAFRGFRTELRAFPVLAVRCVYFGDPLGVFTTSDTALTAEAAEELARHITGVAPERIRCAAG